MPRDAREIQGELARWSPLLEHGRNLNRNVERAGRELAAVPAVLVELRADGRHLPLLELIGLRVEQAMAELEAAGRELDGIVSAAELRGGELELEATAALAERT